MRTLSFIMFLGMVSLAASAVEETTLMKELDIYATAKEEIFCWKKSYGRGVGTIPTECGDKDNQAGLCYKECKDDYKGVGPVCWERCKSGWDDHPASCYKSVFKWKFKKSYGRGVGTIPTGCDGGKENDAGLCYKECKDGYKGVGPVCWKSCSGYTPVNCGAACGSSSKVCVESIFNMVQSVIEMVANVAALVATFGGSAAVKTAQGALRAGFKIARDFIKKGLTKAAFKKFMKSQGQKFGETVAEATLDQLYEGAFSAEDLAWDIAAGMDPTGMVAVVQSFLHEVC